MSEMATTEREHYLIDQVARGVLAAGAVVEQPLDHFWGDGLYVRQITNPKGSIIVTATHKQRHPFFLLSGSLSVFVPGEGVVHLDAPHFQMTEPGTRRLIYAREDSVVVTVHPNPDDSRDLDEIERRVVEPRGELYREWRELIAAAQAKEVGP